jgi:6-phosphogluconolactonase
VTRLTILPDPQAAAEYAAQEIARALREALDRRGVAHLALSGGNTPRAAYQSLAVLLEDWSAVELWYGDERCVGPDDPESTHLLVVESLLAHIPNGERAGPKEHRVRGELDPETAAREYGEELRASVAPAEPGDPLSLDIGLPSLDIRLSTPDIGLPSPDIGLPAPDIGLPALDVSLVGIGEDGHTASLFPGHPEVEDSSGALCLPVRNSPKPPPERVTLSLPVLRAARCSLLLVAGAGKAEALAAALAGPDPRVPASLLVSERLHVVADAAAAARVRPDNHLSSRPAA